MADRDSKVLVIESVVLILDNEMMDWWFLALPVEENHRVH